MTEGCRRDSSCYVRPGGMGPGMVGLLQGGLQLQDDELSVSQSYPALELPARWGGNFLCLGCRPSQRSPGRRLGWYPWALPVPESVTLPCTDTCPCCC